MQLAKAEALANKVVRELRPFCHRIEIAGSIRRKRAEVNDIDLVLIPRDLPRLLKRAQERCTLATEQAQTNVRLNFENGFPLDLWVAHNGERDLLGEIPSNWGAVMLCRTGSMEHNIQLADYARSKGLKFMPYIGIVRERRGDQDEILAARTEEEIYAAVGLEWLPPTRRENL